MITSEELIKIVSVINKTTRSSDPFPSKLYHVLFTDYYRYHYSYY